MPTSKRSSRTRASFRVRRSPTTCIRHSLPLWAPRSRSTRSVAAVILRRMIVKTKEGHQVRSEKGKNLSAPDLTKKEAQERLAQVERFKHLDKWSGRKKK